MVKDPASYRPHRLSCANRLCLRYRIAPFVELLLCLVWNQGLLNG